jgi:RNA polymerase sigma-70 factor (ECF subfamily)
LSSSPFPDDVTGDPLLSVYFEKRANLTRFFAARTGSMALAEDLVQDLYVKLASRKDASEAQSPTALIYRIATNLMLDAARGSRRSQRRDAVWRDETGAFLGGEPVNPSAAPDDELIDRERARELAQAVLTLPPQMQRAFRLHKLEGHSQAETARAMGVSVKAVEKHISGAIRSLTQKLRK